MKTIQHSILGVSVLLFASAVPTFAIEGLQIAVKCRDVILSWPSDEFSGETYIVQYRADLTTTNPWTTLTNYMPPDAGTNLTFFIHSNIVQHPNCSGSAPGSMMMMAASTLNPAPASLALRAAARAQRMAQLTNDIALLMPPPQPVTRVKFKKGAMPTLASPTTSSLALSGTAAEETDGPQPPGGGGAGGGSDFVPETGFYRVVRNGAHLWAITNTTTVSGVVTIPVEVGNDSGDPGILLNVSLVENGVPVSDGSIVMSPIKAPLQVTMDTMQMTNGAHDIFARATWQITTGTNEVDSYSVEADSPPVTINVYNEISFPNWMSSFGQLGNSVVIAAQSAHLDTDWTADVYGGNAGYIGTFSGHTFDGSIYGVWDLTGPPPNFITYTNEPWFQFKVSTPYIDPPSPKTYKQTDPWSHSGDWVMAAHHAWDSFLGHEDLYDELDGYVLLAQGTGRTVRPSPSSGHAFTLHVDDLSAPQPTLDWAALRQALYHPFSRNFVYMGHGNPEGFGINRDHTNRYIPATEIASMLHTIPPGQTNRHGFRMVILDGCSTANGTLPESFGIPHKEGMTDQDFLFASMRPCAFVGWSASKYIGILNGGMNYDHIRFIGHIPEGMTLNGLGIKDAIECARTRTEVNDAYVFGREFKVFGDKELNFNSYNSQ